MAESELGLLESFCAPGEIDNLCHFMDVSTFGRCSRLAGNHLNLVLGWMNRCRHSLIST